MAECFDCGTKYGGDRWVEAVIPDEAWNRIRPEGRAEGAGLLCIGCIAKRLRRISSPDVPVWLLGTEPLMAMAGDPGDDEKAMGILRNYNRIRAEAVRKATKAMLHIGSNEYHRMMDYANKLEGKD